MKDQSQQAKLRDSFLAARKNLAFHRGRARLPENEIKPLALCAKTRISGTVIFSVAMAALIAAISNASPAEQISLPAGHWAFEPIRAQSPPADPTGWSQHPIDRFVRAKLQDHSLKPMPLADPRTLVRRVYFDLIGLPPPCEEVARFAADQRPDAWTRLVDRLLASPQYGERWGRHWLDVARYADTAGDNADYPIPEVRLYRDYVIDAFNSDKPFDRFVEEQLAGDILAKQRPRERYAEQTVATGFLALSRRYGTGPGELWHLVMEDTIETTGRAFLGLTLRCARCHDHKYDPITQEDYYALYGIFGSTRFPWAGSEEVESKKFNRMDFIPLLAPDECGPRMEAFTRQISELKGEIERIEKHGELATKLAGLNQQIESMQKDPAQSTESGKPSLAVTPMAELRKERDALHKKIQERAQTVRAELRALEKPGLPADLPGAYAVQEGKPSDAALQIRGEPSNAGPSIRRGAPKFLSTGEPLRIPDGASGRLEFARWLTRTNHPLTARVMVNRIWQHHFGKGIVSTPSNFGRRGEPPTHPELLDWLTTQFIQSGWSIKAMHRLILSSKTYQLSSFDDPSNLERDPGNRWLWRQDRQRLEAEAIRDAMLMVSGKLDLRRPGEHPFPSIDQWHWTQHNPFKETYPSEHRSIYLMTQRFQRHGFLGLFDGPDTNASTESRRSSTVPLQALYLMNNAFVDEQASAFARRLVAERANDYDRVQLGCELAWSRRANKTEIERAIKYLEHYASELRRSHADAAQEEQEVWTSFARLLLMANAFVYVD